MSFRFSSLSARQILGVAIFTLTCSFSWASPPTITPGSIVAERIDLIRHGESEDNPDAGKIVARLDGTLAPSKGKVLSGWNSASLTMLGVSQAVRAGEVLRGNEKEGVTKLTESLWLYSPLLRTRQTLSGVLLGARLADASALKIRPDTRFFERSAGDVTNLTWDEAAAVWPEMKKGRDAAVFNQIDASYPNGESLDMVYRRASAAIDEAMRQERRIVVVSHELTIKALVAYLTRNALDNGDFAFKVENAKPITLVRKGEVWEIVTQ